MKDWQRRMDGFSGENIKSKQFLPLTRQTEECSQHMPLISWSSSDEEESVLSSSKKMVVMKLNFDDCVSSSGGQIKPRISRIVNKTQQETSISHYKEPKLENDPPEVKSQVIDPCSRSPVFQHRNFSSRKKLLGADSPTADFLGSNDIVLLPESPINNIKIPIPKSPVLSVTRKKRRRTRLLPTLNSASQITSTITDNKPSSPILSRRKINLRKASTSPIFGKTRSQQLKKKRKLLESLDADVEPKFEAPRPVVKLDHGSSQEHNIEDFSQDSREAVIEVPTSQEKRNSTQSSDSLQHIVSMTPSSVEDQAIVEALSSQSTEPGPTIDLDSASKGKGRHVKNGLAQRLQRLVSRQRSAQRMWRYERQLNSSPDGGLVLRVETVVYQCSRWLATCRESSGQRLLLLLESQLMQVKPGATVTIFPPWQSFDPPGFSLPVILSVNLMEVSSSTDLTPPELRTQTKDFSCPCREDVGVAGDQCQFRLPLGDLLQTMFLGRGVSSGARLRAVEALEDQAGPSLRSVTSQTLGVAEAVALHSSSPSASLELVVCCQRLCQYTACVPRGFGLPSLSTQTSQGARWAALGQDARGELCLLELRTCPGVVREGASLHLRKLELTRRTETARSPGLATMLSSLTSRPQTQIFEFSGLGVEATEIEDVTAWVPPPLSLLSVVSEQSDVRLTVIVLVLLATETQLYVCDLSLDVPYVTVNLRPSAAVPELKAGSVVCLRDLGCHAGELFLDRYSGTLSPEDPGSSLAVSEWSSRLGPLAAELRRMEPSLPPLGPSSRSADLVIAAGVVSGVDEESAFSWPVCAACRSELLQEVPGEGLHCALCGSDGPFPNRVALSVFLQAADCHHLPSDTSLRVKLQQSSVERLLPGCQGSNEGYQLELVLGQTVGPLCCLLLSRSSADISLEEVPSWTHQAS